jgi:hypothetical protein
MILLSTTKGKIMETNTELKRKKIKPGSYQIIHVESGKVIAQAHLTGSGLDDYPWEWTLEQGVYFGNTSAKETGVEESLRYCIDTIRALISSYSIGW